MQNIKMETRKDDNINSSKELNSWIYLDDEDDELFLLNDSAHLNTSSLRSDEKYVGFDNNVGETWIYPSNFPERAYQYNIVQAALFHNTLVVLPTGLGKTFIAAVVMYNIYRWYPMGKVIFMAPTRPLVAQQIDACCKVVGIPSSDSVEITGKLSKATRAQLWQSKRVFFATPQSVLSDVQNQDEQFPFQSVKLIVVDEAHRARGRYAYTDVLSYIWKNNKYFRVLALSATPGRRKDDVEDVIRNLFISHIEVRTEESIDVQPFIHKRHIKTVVVKLGQRLSEIRDELFAIVDPHLRKLMDNRLITGNPNNISRNWLVLEHKKFRENITNNIGESFKQELNTDFNICISMYHSIELLERHGVRVFLNNFEQTEDNATKFVIFACPKMRQLIEKVRAEVGPDPFAFTDQSMLDGNIAPIPRHIDFGHPKYEIARDHILTHFESNDKSRAIIFCEYRESVMLMHRLLLQHRPLIRSRVFVGQGGSGSIRPVTQKQQMRIMNDFRNGESNILIATSVAEEGLDVGEVDLIICFDINTTNPTRLVQRIGRTGRRSEGKVILLATEGKEQSILSEVLLERNRLNKSISRSNEFATAFYKHSPRLVPTEFNPKCQKTFIQPQEKQISPPKTSKKSKTKSTFASKVKSQVDLRHFFKKQTKFTNEEELAFEVPTPSMDKTKQTNHSNIATSPSDQIPFSPPKLNSVRNGIFKKCSKFIKSNPQAQIVPTKQSVTSNRLSKDSLQYLIDFSPDFLPNLLSQMQELWKRGINENNIPLKGITADERQTIRAYLHIVDLIGSKEKIENIIKQRHEKAEPLSCSVLNKKYEFIFADLCSPAICHNNNGYLLEQWNKLSGSPLLEQHSNTSFPLSIIYEDDDVYNNNESNNECIVHSKYMSQWEEEGERCANKSNSLTLSDMETVSTRIKPEIEQISKQSTPLRQVLLEKPPLNFIDTPIASKDKCSSPHPIAVTHQEESPSSFFDDQFDDMIAANSEIINYIEANTNTTSNLSHSNCRQKSEFLSADTKAKNTPLQKTNTSASQSLENIISIELSSDEDDRKCCIPPSQGANTDVKTNESLSTEKEMERASPDLFEDFADFATERDMKNQSPTKPSTNVNGPNSSPCLLTKKMLTWREIRSKYANQCESKNLVQSSKLDEGVMGVSAKTRRRRIILSESDGSGDDIRFQDNSSTAKPVNSGARINAKPKKRLISSFINNEADHSGSASEDENEKTIGEYMMDSVVVHDDEAENDITNMMPVYLQSVKSPIQNWKGKFKIPERRRFNDASKIFSQKVPEDSCYVYDSFIVDDEEPEIEQMTCPLERAEEILRNKRRIKRKAKLAFDDDQKSSKKRRILRIPNSSDEE